MHYSKIKTFDIANGPGVRTSLFVSGCRNNCRGCFNPETWSFDFGCVFDDVKRDELLSTLDPHYIKGLTILGGEPLEPENQRDILELVRKVRLEYPQKNIWLFTGFTWEELHDECCRAHTGIVDEILSNIDILVEGPFIEQEKNPGLRFRGSSNQRIVDMSATREKGYLVEWEDDEIFSAHSRETLERMATMNLT